MWAVDYTEEYEAWFDSLDEECKTSVASRVYLLEQFGPQLSRPYADTLKGSKYANLKELRASTSEHVLRVAFYFDVKRKAFLLCGGDKKGKDEKRFYKSLIQEAEKLIEKYNS